MFKFEYIALILLAIPVLIIFINLIEGLVRGLKKGVGTFGVMIASAGISALATLIVCTPDSPLVTMIIDYAKSLLTAEQIQDILGIEELSRTLVYYITMIIAPFFFVVVFAVLAVVLSVIWAIVYAIISPKKKKGQKKKKMGAAQRLGGLGVGVACGLVVSFIMLIPIVGVLDIAVAAGEVIVDEVDEEKLNAIEGVDVPELVNDASESVVMKIYKGATGWAFNSLASAEFEGERVYLKDDVAAVVAIVPNISGFSANIEQYDSKQVEAIRGIVDGLDKSTMIKYALSGVVLEAAGKWSEGDTFMGMEKISAGEMLDPMIDSMITAFATKTTKDTIGEDLYTVADVFEILIENNVLKNMNNQDELLITLGEDGIIGDLIITINKNERMMVLSDEITKLSVRVIASSLELPGDSKAVYDALIADIVLSLNESRDSDDRVQAVSGEFSEIFAAHGLEITDEQAVLIAEALVTDLGEVNKLENIHIEEFFLIYYGAAPADSTLAAVSSQDKDRATDNKITVNSNGTVTVGERELTSGIYTTNNYADSAAFKLGISNDKDIGEAKYLYSIDAVGENSAIVTLADIMEGISKYKDCEDPDDEARKVSDMFAEAATIFADIDFEGNSYDQLIAEIGVLLDKMNATEIFGKETVNNLMTAIFQSKLVRDELRLTAKEASELSNKLNNLVGESKSYESLMSTVSNTISMMNAITNDTSFEERLENTYDLIQSMDKETAEVIGDMITVDAIIGYGASADKANVVADSVKDLFNNMAEFNENNSGDTEAAKKEADAVNKVLDLAVKGQETTDKENGMFNSLDENGEEIKGTGSLDTTAEDLVATIVGSKVVSSTIKNAANSGEENPYGIHPGDEDKRQITEAMENYYAENSVGMDVEELEELEATLDALAIVINIPPIDYTK